MKKIKNLKKKIFGLTLVVGLLVLSIVGTTMAYFTDVEEKTNVFTSGNVAITLSGNVLNEANGTTGINAYPGMNIGSAATVTNIGSEDAYVGIIVTFTEAVSETLARALFNGIPATGVTVNYGTAVEGGKNVSKLYFSYANTLNRANPDNTDDTVTFFSDMTVPTSWDHTEMAIFKNLEIKVSAYATQTYGFTDAETALRTAFDAWPAVSNGN